MPELYGGKAAYSVDPAQFAELAQDWRRAGARIIGGCCGSTPEHIHALRDARFAQPIV
jgi:homocysteine S-methyltransferase